MSCAPMVCTGLNEVIGSWKTMPMSPPRSFARRVSFASRASDVDRRFACRAR